MEMKIINITNNYKLNKLLKNIAKAIDTLKETVGEDIHNYNLYVGIDIAKILVNDLSKYSISKGKCCLPVKVYDLNVILDITIQTDTFYLINKREV